MLENSEQPNYWTEKLADAYLSWSFPIYWGCPNILDFFDKESIFLIDPDASYADIENMVKKPITQNMMRSLAESRIKILNQYNIWEIIHKKIKSEFV